MALLTALLQGASPAERKVTPRGLNEEQQLVCAAESKTSSKPFSPTAGNA